MSLESIIGLPFIAFVKNVKWNNNNTNINNRRRVMWKTFQTILIIPWRKYLQKNREKNSNLKIWRLANVSTIEIGLGKYPLWLPWMFLNGHRFVSSIPRKYYEWTKAKKSNNNCYFFGPQQNIELHFVVRVEWANEQPTKWTTKNCLFYKYYMGAAFANPIFELFISWSAIWLLNVYFK